MEADHVLIIDRETHLAHIAPIAAARTFLKAQHPPPPELTPYELEEMRRAIEETLITGWREVKVDPAAVQRAMDEERQAIARITAYLDQWPNV